MTYVKIYIFLVLGLSTATGQDLKNEVYDLSVGVQRYFSNCEVCIFPGLAGIEKVLDHVKIDNTPYAEVEYTAYEWDPNLDGKGGYTYRSDTLYYREEGQKLYQKTEDRDSLIFDFSFEAGMDFQGFFEDWLPVPLTEYLWEDYAIPNTFHYDTTVTFPDGKDFRIVYAQSFPNPDSEYTIPSQKFFIENVLTDNRNGILAPVTHDSLPLYRPFYYVGKIGVVFYELSHHRQALVGYMDSDGNKYGAKYEVPINAPETSELPEGFELHQNYPNPFNPGTTISYKLPFTTHVRLEIFDMLGQKVALLKDTHEQAGSHQVIFNAPELSSGMYVYRLQTTEYMISRVMFFLK